MKIVQWPIRVYYEDTDSGGVVYYANYLKFFERGRTEYLRTQGFEQDQLRDEFHILFVVTEVTVKYRLPARFNDALMVQTRIIKLQRAGLTFSQTLHIQSDLSTLLCSATTRIACLHEHTFRPIRIPDVMRFEVLDDTGS